MKKKCMDKGSKERSPPHNLRQKPGQYICCQNHKLIADIENDIMDPVMQCTTLLSHSGFSQQKLVSFVTEIHTLSIDISLRDAWASCNPSNEECNRGSLRNNEIQCYWESENDNDRINIEWEGLSLNDWLKVKYGEVDETMKKKILTKHWRKRFGIDYDDNDDFYDPNQCRGSKNDEIRERIIQNLHEEWFNGTSKDEEDIEGIIDYLKPTLYDGFVDLYEEEFNKRRCRLLGMSYIEPLPIIIQQVKITRYSLGPGEVYTKVKISYIEELPRTRNNIATIRSNIMDEIFENYEDEMT
ncbi:hypothetical protein Tco_1148127 [Tanacetum coccineum]